MALPVGVTSALAHIDAPVSFSGTPAKVYLEVVPNVRLNHIATGTPLADFIDVRTPGIGDPATVTLPHTDQAGFQDESGLPVTNWSYAATIRYELDGQRIHVPVKHFQILTGQTDVDLALIPVGEPAEIILGNVAFVSSVNGRSGAVTLTPQDAGLFADPNADRIVFWDDSASKFDALQFTSPLSITGTTLSVLAATESLPGRVELATAAETTTGTDNTRAVHPQGLKSALDLKNNVIALGYRARTGTDDPTLYPLGPSNFLASSGDAWVWPDAASFKQILTFRQSFGTGTGGTLQIGVDYADATKPLYFRVWDSNATTTWGAWYRLATTAYVDAADALKANINSPTFTGTVGGITASMVGLGNVNNTSDAAKPVSTAQQTALDLKANLASPTFTGTVGGITKSMVGLGSVDNTADTAKPVSTAQQTALNLKANLASPTFTGTVGGIDKTMVGLANVDNTADTAKPVSTAQQTALDAKMPLNHTINTRTATPYNMVAADDLVVANLGTAIAINLPDPTTVPVGREYQLKNIGAGTLTVASQGTSKTLDGAASQTLAQWAKATYYSNGTAWFTI